MVGNVTDFITFKLSAPKQRCGAVGSSGAGLGSWHDVQRSLSLQFPVEIVKDILKTCKVALRNKTFVNLFRYFFFNGLSLKVSPSSQFCIRLRN